MKGRGEGELEGRGTGEVVLQLSVDGLYHIC